MPIIPPPESRVSISAAAHDWFLLGLPTHSLLSAPIYPGDQWLWCSGLPETFLEALSLPVCAGLSQARVLPWGAAGFLEGREELVKREVLEGAGRQDIGRSMEYAV